MPDGFVCLRAVDFRRWADPRPADIDATDAPAWCLKDMSPVPGDNALSMYLLPADRADELAPVVAAAVAAQRNELGHAEFILFDSKFLVSEGLTVESLPGQTAHEEVNRLHVDVKVSAKRAASLAATLYGKADLRRVLLAIVKAQLIAAKGDGKLDLARIQSEKVKKAIDTA